MTDSEGNEIGKLFVGGLSQSTNNGSLRVYFSRFGEVDDAVVMMDNKTGRSRGFGYVKYRDAESVISALEAKPHIVDSKEVDAKQCNVNMKGRNRRSLKIFVGGIGLDQDADSIKNYFRQYGRVTDVNLMMDSNKQRHRGFAFVGFEDEAVVKRLINLHYVSMNNKQVEIKAMEPPNFGRKLGIPASGTTLMNQLDPTESTCGFEHVSNDPVGLVTNGLTGISPNHQYGPHAYLVNHPANIIAQTCPSLSAGYNQPHELCAPNLLPESLFQPNTFVHQLPSAQYNMKAIGEPIFPSGSSAPSYLTTKHPVSYILTNNSYHAPPTINPNVLGSYPSNTPSSFYATIPCQLLPQQTPNMNQLMSHDKTTLPGWVATTTPGPSVHSNPTHLTLCPQSTGSLLTCNQLFSQNQTPSSSQLANGSANPLAPSYYALCPQYTTFQVAADQLGNSTYLTNTSMTPSQQLSTNTSGQTVHNSEEIVLQTSTSRNISPIGAEIEQESNYSLCNRTISSKQPYNVSQESTPAMVLTNQSGSIMMPQSAINIPQQLWNQSGHRFVYSSLPFGWAVQPNPPTWPTTSYPTSSIPSQAFVDKHSATTAESKNQDAPQKLEEIVDQTTLSRTNPSGDNTPEEIMMIENTNKTATSQRQECQTKDRLESLLENQRHIMTHAMTTQQTPIITGFNSWHSRVEASNTNPAILSTWENSSSIKWNDSTVQPTNKSWFQPSQHLPTVDMEGADHMNRTMKKIHTNRTINTSESRVPIKTEMIGAKTKIEKEKHLTLKTQTIATTNDCPIKSQVPSAKQNEMQSLTVGSREFGDRHETCMTWLQRNGTTTNNTVTEQLGNTNTGNIKQRSVIHGVDLELNCHIPAGASGDFNHPMNMTCYDAYQM